MSYYTSVSIRTLAKQTDLNETTILCTVLENLRYTLDIIRFRRVPSEENKTNTLI